ncbi:aldehyde dehydrogenase family protein [Heliophilum fasciatum]|uniref:3-sulfolactaldehyde dehydrogenase n=1 Tax=Heliophilum fasciatum TaxID=35700 RepID=A0A4R2RJA5_9FIRM|nr:aldehyde dehydrogenase family protein [Heliophilum fasciatum]MCW2278289.1 acyl-CoA reductase-like NAD-dependent aldehyde dehydrogenase [Heliophilum fasciatum]TCP63912.1 acyl-CoA reductase-like NAD-dependent aldehyde dehydrogenase [Heliophilum fasciatum]
MDQDKKVYGLFIDGQWVTTGTTIPVLDKFSGKVYAHVAQAEQAHVTKAVDAAQLALKTPLPAWRRSAILQQTAERLTVNKEKLGELIAIEAGKPLKDAIAEVGRAAETLRLSANEAMALTGEAVPVHAFPGSENRLAFTLRVPLGVVCAISPFNFPLNLLCHKVGPALAAGNAIVAKPASATPLIALKLAEYLAEAGLPAGWFHVLFGAGSTVGEWLLDEPRFAAYSFTGSYAVGLHIRQRVGLRKSTMELGSNSATIIHHDADLDGAARQCARMAFANAGQVCISVQRILVHRFVFNEFVEKLAAQTGELIIGDPKNPHTDVGPMINQKEAERVVAWVEQAVDDGARLVMGGTRQGALVQPTILTHVHPKMPVWCEEIFGPVVSVAAYDYLEEAIDKVNDSAYGLQAGVFTRSIDVALSCAKQLEVGGVIINDVSTYRADNMPYGGVKNSGTGREGPHYAVQELTETRVVVFNHR